MFIEGKNAVLQALESDRTINKIFIDKNYQTRKDDVIHLSVQKKVKIEYLPKVALDKKSKTGRHQGYIADAVDFVYCQLDDILACAKERGEKPFIIMLDGIEDPHNLGAIVRSCECGGVHGIVLSKNRSVQVNETVVRTSTGAINNMNIARVNNLKEAVDFFRENDIWVYAAEAGGESIYNKKLDGGVAVIIGSEGFGVKKSLQSYCDGVISLPLKGKVNSLNASVACGVIVFEILRQREQRSCK